MAENIGRKDDGFGTTNCKLRYDLLPSLSTQAIVEVLTFGANKYGAENWRLVDNHKNRYYAAAMRHIEAWRQGEQKDKESGLHHLAHALCCLTFLITPELEGVKNDM